MTDNEKLAIGLDYGGKNIKAGLMARDGCILTEHQSATGAELSYQAVVEKLVLAIRELLVGNESRVIGVGIGSPGLIDLEGTTIFTSPNFLYWKDQPLKKDLQKSIDLPIFINNDVNMLAIGEHRFGAARGCRNFICLALGTGVGGAIFVDGELYRGATGTAGELGHMTINFDGPICKCGNRGDLESYIGADYLVKRASKKIRGCPELTPKIIAEMAYQGDRDAAEVMAETGRYLGVACASFINIFNPEKIIIGGGIAQSGDILFRAIQDEVGERAYTQLVKNVEIIPAQLGNRAGLMGAAATVFESIRG
ncbi:ROK family protein [candidate division KSB1 bacterium]|nr:ROK family protein [candidate division KSB1 bacterium]